MTVFFAISQSVIAVIAVVVALNLFTVLLAFSFIRARRAQAALARAAAGAQPRGAAPGEKKAKKPVTRREFFRGGLIAGFFLFAAEYGLASIAFLWPNLKGGFGSVIAAGSVEDIRSQIEGSDEPYYYGAGRFYIVPYEGSGVDEAAGLDYEADGLVADAGGFKMMALYQKCVHLGCRVPFCKQSQWFECPCHGSKYNSAGEYQLGPAPRGMDRFRVSVEGDTVMVDTSEVILGPVRGAVTAGSRPEGPFCVGG